MRCVAHHAAVYVKLKASSVLMHPGGWDGATTGGAAGGGAAGADGDGGDVVSDGDGGDVVSDGGA
tara:strand:- start:7 stop:201 length:195 start_codon:yes stop_codon:yes gene_type:complete